MTENGNPKENPQAERINGTIKNEILLGREFHSLREVNDAIAAAVAFYNNERPHMSIGMMTPAEASETSGERDMKWISYRESAIKRSKGRVSLKIVYLWIPVKGFLPGYALQSTLDRDISRERVNYSQG